MPIILGIDEVGRGPWAGPLVVGAVILGKKFADFPKIQMDIIEEYNEKPKKSDIKSYFDEKNLKNVDLFLNWQNIKDSKKLSAKKREELNKVILKNAEATSLGWVSAVEIDQFGLGSSLNLAARRAVKQILTQKTKFDQIIIDGTGNMLTGTPLENRVVLLKKADSLVKEVAAASIIAKVARDTYMIHLSRNYPEYGFETHVGYGTAKHIEALEHYGICPEHRRSFRPIKQYDHDQKVRTTKSLPPGQIAEIKVAGYLCSKGHHILAQNFKTKTCEIDIVSTCDKTIYFTEVKYQASKTGNPLERIHEQKQEQMRYASQVYLEQHPTYKKLQPMLAAASVIGANFDIADWFPLS